MVKIQIAAVKDEKTGVIQARALLKLLFDEEGNPALFLERTYPNPCSKEYEKSAKNNLL